MRTISVTVTEKHLDKAIERMSKPYDICEICIVSIAIRETLKKSIATAGRCVQNEKGDIVARFPEFITLNLIDPFDDCLYSEVRKQLPITFDLELFIPLEEM